MGVRDWIPDLSKFGFNQFLNRTLARRNHSPDPLVSAFQRPPTAPLDSRALLRYTRKIVRVKGVWLRTPPARYGRDGHNYVRPAFPDLTQGRGLETCRAGYAASSEQRL